MPPMPEFIHSQLMLLHYIPFRTMQYSVKIAIKFATNEILVSIISTTLVIAICLVAIMIIDKKLFIVEKQWCYARINIKIIYVKTPKKLIYIFKKIFNYAKIEIE